MGKKTTNIKGDEQIIYVDISRNSSTSRVLEKLEVIIKSNG